MQILKENDFIEDPYHNTLFDDPLEFSSYYRNAEELYIGTLKLECSDEILSRVLENYYNGLFLEEIVKNHYNLHRGNDKGNFWHEMIGDSAVSEKGYLITSILYSDSYEQKRIGYFVSNALDPSLDPYGFTENMDLQEVDRFYTHLKENDIAYKLKSMLNHTGKEEWYKEPIENYIETILDMIKKEEA